MPDIKNNRKLNAYKASVSTAKPDSAVLAGPDYVSAHQAIGSLCREMMRSRGSISARNLKLELMVRLKLCTDPAQKIILVEALRQITNKHAFIVK